MVAPYRSNFQEKTSPQVHKYGNLRCAEVSISITFINMRTVIRSELAIEES